MHVRGGDILRRAVLGLLMLGLGLGAEGVSAQDTTRAAVPGDTLAPATYIYGSNAAIRSKGVARVRRRIARKAPSRVVRREVYPVIVMPAATGLAAPDMLPAAVSRDTAALVREVEQALLTAGRYRTVDIVFPSGQRTPLPVSNRVLDAVGQVLATYPSLRVEVGGHTDATGSATANQRLSAARAEAVRRFLLDRFPIAPERVTARGYGESRPVASNAHPTGRALNRRVEFVVRR